MEFAPCNGCRRHVRSGEDACPFCGGSVGAVARPTRAGLPPRYVAIFAASLSACSQAEYGAPAPPPDVGSDTRAIGESDAGGLGADADPSEAGTGARDAPVYGAPPDDGG